MCFGSSPEAKNPAAPPAPPTEPPVAPEIGAKDSATESASARKRGKGQLVIPLSNPASSGLGIPV